jgi:hypothetical protein
LPQVEEADHVGVMQLSHHPELLLEAEEGCGVVAQHQLESDAAAGGAAVDLGFGTSAVVLMDPEYWTRE